MKQKFLVIQNQTHLQQHLRELRHELRSQEQDLRSEGVGLIALSPAKTLSTVFTPAASGTMTNPIGKLFSAITKKALRKQGFFTRLAAGLVASRAGKAIEKKLLRKKPK